MLFVMLESCWYSWSWPSRFTKSRSDFDQLAYLHCAGRVSNDLYSLEAGMSKHLPGNFQLSSLTKLIQGCGCGLNPITKANLYSVSKA